MERGGEADGEDPEGGDRWGEGVIMFTADFLRNPSGIPIVSPCMKRSPLPLNPAARWADPRGRGITTQEDSLGELQVMIANAVGVYFDSSEAPMRIKVHFSQASVLQVF